MHIFGLWEQHTYMGRTCKQNRHGGPTEGPHPPYTVAPLMRSFFHFCDVTHLALSAWKPAELEYFTTSFRKIEKVNLLCIRSSLKSTAPTWYVTRSSPCQSVYNIQLRVAGNKSTLSSGENGLSRCECRRGGGLFEAVDVCSNLVNFSCE